MAACFMFYKDWWQLLVNAFSYIKKVNYIEKQVDGKNVLRGKTGYKILEKIFIISVMLKKLLLPLLVMAVAAVACSSGVSQEEMAARTRVALSDINKKLLLRLGGTADSIREAQKSTLLGAYIRYCKGQVDLETVRSAYGVCTLYDEKEGPVKRVVDLELYRFGDLNEAGRVYYPMLKKMEQQKGLKPDEGACGGHAALRIHQVYCSGSLLLAVNVQGNYSEKELAVMRSVLEEELNRLYMCCFY